MKTSLVAAAVMLLLLGAYLAFISFVHARDAVRKSVIREKRHCFKLFLHAMFVSNCLVLFVGILIGIATWMRGGIVGNEQSEWLMLGFYFLWAFTLVFGVTSIYEKHDVEDFEGESIAPFVLFSISYIALVGITLPLVYCLFFP